MKWTKRHLEIIDVVNQKLALMAGNSERAYRTALHQFVALLEGKHLTLERARGEHVLQYLAMLREKGKSDATIHGRHEALRSMFGTLYRMDKIKVNIAEQIKDLVPRRQKRQVRPNILISADKVEQIRVSPAANTRPGIRDRALLALIFGAGLRRDEVRKLNLGDFLVTPLGTVYVQIKGAKAGENQERALPDWCAELVSELVTQRKTESAENEDPIFTFYYRDERAGQRVSYSTVGRIFKKWCRHCGIKAAPHSGRATYGTHLLKLGFKDREVAEALGHKSDRQVRVYDKRAHLIDRSAARHLNYKKLLAPMEENG